MGHNRAVITFFGRLILFYGLLIAPWPGVKSGFVSLYVACGDAIFGSVVREGTVHFHPMDDPVVRYDIRMAITVERTGYTHKVDLRSRHMAYIPLAVLTALVLATPMPWPKKFGNLVLGLIVVMMIILGRHVLLVLFLCAQPAVDLLGPVYNRNMIMLLTKYLGGEDIVTSMAGSFLVWLLVCFRARDWESWIGRGKGKTVGTASTEGAAGNRSPSGAKRKRSRRRSRLQRAVGSA